MHSVSEAPTASIFERRKMEAVGYSKMLVNTSNITEVQHLNFHCCVNVKYNIQ